MTVFAAFASSFRFLTTTGITDVATMITDFRSETVTNGSPVWTEPTANNFKSPVDANGRFFIVGLTRSSAIRLRWTITDQNNATVCDREIDITASPATVVNYYTGQYHAWIETMVVTPEIACAGILDASPLTQGSYTVYSYGGGYRNNAGSIDAQGSNTGQLFMLDNGASAMSTRIRALGVNVANTTIGLLHAAGNQLYFPVEIATNITGTQRWNGRMYQAFAVDSSIGTGTLKTILIGTAGETGTFRVISGLNSIENMRYAVRQS